MVPNVAPLPREPDILIEMVLELRGENGKLRAILETLRRTLYGARSERFDSDSGQLALGLESMRNIGGLPKHLPREDVVIEPAIDCCPCCQGTLHRIGEDVSEMLDIVPAILRVKRIHRPRYGCRACESAVVQAPAPPRPIDAGLPTTALLAHIAAAKFAWHLPLHRQTQMLAAYGINLDRSTLVHWIGRTAWWLEPLYVLLTATVMAAGKVFCDDTPLPVLDRTRRRTRIARLWCYAVDDRPWQGPAPPAVIYRYAEDRRGRHVKEHLDGFHGLLQVDGYSGYDKLARSDRPGGAITLAYCLAHARREFFDVHKRTKTRLRPRRCVGSAQSTPLRRGSAVDRQTSASRCARPRRNR